MCHPHKTTRIPKAHTVLTENLHDKCEVLLHSEVLAKRFILGNVGPTVLSSNMYISNHAAFSLSWLLLVSESYGREILNGWAADDIKREAWEVGGMNDITSQASFETIWIIGTWKTNWTRKAPFLKSATSFKKLLLYFTHHRMSGGPCDHSWELQCWISTANLYQHQLCDCGSKL